MIRINPLIAVASLLSIITIGCARQPAGVLSALQVCQDPEIEKTILSIDTSYYQMVTYRYDSIGHAWDIVTTGNDARTYTATRYNRSIPGNHCVLTFDYKSSTGVRLPQFFFLERQLHPDTVIDIISEAHSTRNDVPDLEPTSNGEWKTIRLVIDEYRMKFNWANHPVDSVAFVLALDWGNEPDKDISIRNLCITERNEQELELFRQKCAETAFRRKKSERIDAYLNAEFNSHITSVSVDKQKVTIRGHADDGGCLLAEIMPHEEITEIQSFTNVSEISRGDFSISLDRFVNDRDGFSYDRLLSRWAIVKPHGDKHELLSHARYADDVTPIASPAPVPAANKKGVLGMAISEFDGAFDPSDLHCGTEANTLNLLEWLMTTPKVTRIRDTDMPAIPLPYGGRTYYVSGAKVAEFDELFQTYNTNGMQLSVYIELGVPASATDPAIVPILVYPDAGPANQYMPNLSSFEGMNAYAAIIQFLTSRYSRDENGRVQHWCIHNEVNAGKMWCNMGPDVSEAIYTDTYIRSMRLVYNILRQYDQTAAVLGCFEHCWAKKTISGADYPARNMMDRLVKYSHLEGDFWWGIGYHPYSLRMKKPQFWLETSDPETKKNISFSNSTNYITPMNLEVLCHWLTAKQNLYKGKTKRICHLNEQGFVSPTYDEADLQLQAAAAAYLWKRVSLMPEIDGVQWFAWNDSKSQPLLLGLRRYPDSDNPSLHYQRKPVWYVWAAAGTERENEVFAPYLKVIGIDSWDRIQRHD